MSHIRVIEEEHMNTLDRNTEFLSHNEGAGDRQNGALTSWL